MKYPEDFINKIICGDCLSDKEIRKPLLKRLYSNKNHLKIIEELDVNNAVIDIATIDENYFCGYEIKSDRDTLKRLPMQMQIYNYVFDKITIVVGKSKLLKAIYIIPDFWGVILAKEENNNINLIQIRLPEVNNNININWLSKKLWRSDMVIILKKMNLYKGRSNYCRNNLIKIIVENTSTSKLKSYIRNVLINRVYDRKIPELLF